MNTVENCTDYSGSLIFRAVCMFCRVFLCTFHWKFPVLRECGRLTSNSEQGTWDHSTGQAGLKGWNVMAGRVPGLSRSEPALWPCVLTYDSTMALLLAFGLQDSGHLH